MYFNIPLGNFIMIEDRAMQKNKDLDFSSSSSSSNYNLKVLLTTMTLKYYIKNV